MGGLVEFAPLQGGGAFDELWRAASDHLTRIARGHRRPAVFGDGAIQGERNVRGGVEQRPVEVE
jgi:hypothetical protein